MRQYNRLQAGIHNILINEWDPIGVRDQPLAQDEYDSYIPGIIRLLERGAPESRLAEHLDQLETIEMGLPANHERNQRVATRLFNTYTHILAAPRHRLPNYARVRLTTNRYEEDGVGVGASGYIIEVYDDGYEVEFSAADGTTIARIVATRDELERAE